MPWRSPQNAEKSPWKLLLWTAVAGLVFGLIGFGEIAEDWLRVARNSVHKHPASGEVVVVKIDDEALKQEGNWPWPRRKHAALVDRLSDVDARKIVFDINFSFPSNGADDAALANSIKKSGRVILAARARSGREHGVAVDSWPIPAFAKHAEVATLSFAYNYQNAVWRLPYALTIDERKVPSLSAAASGISGSIGEQFPIDYSIDTATFPSVSAGDVLAGRVAPTTFAGKTVFIGTDSDVIGDRYFIPGYGQVGGVMVHATGAETLLDGRPLNVGWLPTFLLALGTIVACTFLRSTVLRSAILAAVFATFILAPIGLESNLVFIDITPAVFVILVYATSMLWDRYRSRGVINAISGLPNLNALRRHAAGRKLAMVAVRVMNYDEALSALPPGSERQLVEQIVARLSVGSPDRILYQGDGGIFAWFCEPRQPFGNHLEALHALFRNPARIGNQPVDLTVGFGVEVGSARSLDSRLASALVAADEAAREGLKWRYHDPETQEDKSWRLSMLSQLDAAIDKGEVWVAYQPKLDLATRRIIGAEALARWTHPEKGPIATSEFVAAAEQHDRIAKLTDFVLENAIRSAATLLQKRPGFEVAVNMSARLMHDKQFVLRLSAALARHSVPPQALTLELTETAALASTGEGLAMIGRLRDMGVRISIDDYGTGMSTLDYLKRVPANEIKIDQSFIKGIIDNRSDCLMVHSTIQLAHSLGRRVVAEGVEQREIIDVLVDLGCDVAQGYAIGRPMSLDSLLKRLTADRKRGAA